MKINFFMKNLEKEFDCITLPKSNCRIFIGIIAYSTKRSNSNHIVTKASWQGAIQYDMGTLSLFLSLYAAVSSQRVLECTLLL